MASNTLSFQPSWSALGERRIFNDTPAERSRTQAIRSGVGKRIVAAWDEAEQIVVSRGAAWDRISLPSAAKGETLLDWPEMELQDIKNIMRAVGRQLNDIRQEDRI